MSSTELRRILGVASAVVAAGLLLFVAACGGNDDEGGEAPAAGAPAGIDPGAYSSEVDHRFVPLASVKETVFEGTEEDPDTGENVEIRVESRVLDKTEVILGVETAVVEVKDFEGDELVERTLDYYAQREDGSVWYFGERVENYEEGEAAGHEGQWLAGKNGAEPGLFMPAEPKVGARFQQERAPGVAEDESTVVAVGVDVKTPAGSFSDCIRTKDFAPIDKKTEFKFYCPDVGLVREEFEGGKLDLVRSSQPS